MNQEADIEVEIRDAATHLFGLLADRDADAFYDIFSQSTTMVLNGQAIESWAAQQQSGRAWLSSLRDAACRIKRMTVQALTQDSGISTTEFEFRAIDQDGTVTDEKSVQTWVWCRTSTGWKVVHSHLSGTYLGPHRDASRDA